MEQIIFSFMKNHKNEANPQVTMANASDIKSRIKANCSDIPLTFKFKRNGVSPTNDTSPVDLDFYNNPIFTTPWTRNQQRSQFIYTVIRTHSYYIVEGKKLGVGDEEIFRTFTRLCHSLQEIEAFTHRKEFEEYLWKCYLQELEDEHEERLSYQNAPLLNQLMMNNSTPELVWKSILSVTKSIKSLDDQRKNLYYQLKYKKISGSDYDNLINPLDEQIDQAHEYQEHLLWTYKRMVDNTFRRRQRLKLAFANTHRSLNNMSVKPIECRTITLCNFYIDEYCRWFNQTFKREIAETQRLEKLAKRKQKRLANKKPDSRLEVLRPFLNSGLSEQRIAEQTGIAKSTVNRLMKKLV